MFVLSASSQPDFLVLAGPAFNATPFEESVCKGFEQASEDANQRWTSIQVSRHSYLMPQKAWHYANISVARQNW